MSFIVTVVLNSFCSYLSNRHEARSFYNNNIHFRSTSLSANFRVSMPLKSADSNICNFSLNRVSTFDDLLHGSELCMREFFCQKPNILQYFMLNELYKNHREDLFQKFNSQSNSMFSVKDKCGQILGFAEVYQWEFDSTKFSRVAETYDTVKVYPKIANLAVDQNYRGIGLGRRLLEACIDQAVDWGHDEVLLLVDQDNKRALDVYHKYGFEQIGLDRKAARYEFTGLYLQYRKHPRLLLRYAVRKTVEVFPVRPVVQTNANMSLASVISGG